MKPSFFAPFILFLSPGLRAEEVSIAPTDISPEMEALVHQSMDAVYASYVNVLLSIDVPESSVESYQGQLASVMFSSGAMLAQCSDSSDLDRMMSGFAYDFEAFQLAHTTESNQSLFQAHARSIGFMHSAFRSALAACNPSTGPPVEPPPVDPPSNPPVAGVPNPEPPTGPADIVVEPGRYTIAGSTAALTSEPMRQAYNRASWGDVIDVKPGRVGKFKVEKNVSGATKNAPIVFRGSPGAMVNMNPSGGSASMGWGDRSIAHTWFYDIDFEADDRASLLTNNPKRDGWTYPGVRFYRCSFGVNGWSWLTGAGIQNKWGLLTYALDDVWFVGCDFGPIQKEHTVYSHNHAGNVYFVGCHLFQSGRTAFQFACRPGEGPAGTGDIWLVDNLAEINCKQMGGGGYGISMNGGCPETDLYVIRHRSSLGNPNVVPKGLDEVCGAISVHQGEHTQSYGGVGNVWVEGCEFSRGPRVGKGSSRRPEMKFEENIESLTIVGTTCTEVVGTAEGLSIQPNGWVNPKALGQAYPTTIGKVVLDRGNQIAGDCLWGSKTFKDRDSDGDGLLDGDGYRAMIDHIVSSGVAVDLPWSDVDSYATPNAAGNVVVVTTWDGVSKWPEAPPVVPVVNPIPNTPGLWAWGNGDQVSLVDGPRGKLISQMDDQSGNIPPNHWTNGGANRPAFQVGLDLPASAKGGPYSTSLPLIGLDKYASNGAQHYGNVLKQASFADPDEWYIAAVFGNTRPSGKRELLGNDLQNFFRIDQADDSAALAIASSLQGVVAAGGIPSGFVLLELWRDSGNAIHCFANGVDVSAASNPMPGTFDLKGLGYDGKGSSQWDDYFAELAIYRDLPASEDRAAVRGHLMSKWSIQ